MRSIGAALLIGMLLPGCSLGGGSGKSGGPAPERDATRGVVTLRFAAGDPGVLRTDFLAQLARVSRGHLRAVGIEYDTRAPDVDERIARDVIAGKLDVADVAARAWQAEGVDGFESFQSPFLVTSDALADEATADPRISGPLLRSLAPRGITGLSLQPAAIRYLFARRALPSAGELDGARVRFSASVLTSDMLRALRARPTSAVRNGEPAVTALRSGRLDAIESDMHVALSTGYARAAPYVSSPLFAKVTTLVANSAHLRKLGPEAVGWLRTAARRTAAAVRARHDRTAWRAACGSGVRESRSTPEQIDALQRALLDVHAGLEGDVTAARAVDRIGLLAVDTPRTDPWAGCGSGRAPASPTRAIDGNYRFAISRDDEATAGSSPGNDGDYRIDIGNGRYAVIHSGPPGSDPERPGWDLARDPVEVGSLVLRGDVATFRPETALIDGAQPRTYRFELFRERLRWTHVSGAADFLWSAHPWRRER